MSLVNSVEMWRRVPCNLLRADDVVKINKDSAYCYRMHVTEYRFVLVHAVTGEDLLISDDCDERLAVVLFAVSPGAVGTVHVVGKLPS
jgi:hypothetical protein